MQHRAGLVGLGMAQQLRRFAVSHRKWFEMAGSAAAGYVMSGSYIFGGIAPFGVAFCATLPMPHSVFAAMGAVIGYTFAQGPISTMKYLVAVAFVVALKWLFGGKVKEKFATVASALTALLSLGIANGIMAVISDATLYDALTSAAEVFLGVSAAYFFTRSLAAIKGGWESVNRADVSCLIVSFAIVVMGFTPLKIGGASLGRIISVLVVLLCARSGGESGGSVAGITAGIAMGLSGGDYSYAIAAYGFGGLLSGVFANIGRIATAGSFIVVNMIAALFTQSSGEVYISLIEIAVASVIFVAIPQSAVSKFKMLRQDGKLENAASAQVALRGRLSEMSGALQNISSTTREVSTRLSKMESGGYGDMSARVADAVCTHCGMKTTCWQFKRGETDGAMDNALQVLKREGSINRERMPKYFTVNCCKLDTFVAELNVQFQAHVSKAGVQRKVSRVRDVVTDQFDGLAIMLDELSKELCGQVLLDSSAHKKVQQYLEKEGFNARQVRLHSDSYERVTAEITLAAYEKAKLDGPKTAVELSGILEAEFDLPYISATDDVITAVFTEKATFSVELGTYQIKPDGNKICGDAYVSIPNRMGKAHFILSDGMGSGGGAAVDAHMASGLISQLISVGLGHDAALKMVNSALLIKSGEESLATIDICSIDLYTGQADFYKAGAAPTYILRAGNAGYVESTSLPAGILQGVDFDKSGIKLREDDCILMISDGAVATGIDWIKSELTSNSGLDMQRLAEKIAMTSKIRRTDGHEDDITVMAIALRKGI